jgi:hypothetical protein
MPASYAAIDTSRVNEFATVLQVCHALRVMIQCPHQPYRVNYKRKAAGITSLCVRSIFMNRTKARRPTNAALLSSDLRLQILIVASSEPDHSWLFTYACDSCALTTGAGNAAQRSAHTSTTIQTPLVCPISAATVCAVWISQTRITWSSEAEAIIEPKTHKLRTQLLCPSYIWTCWYCFVHALTVKSFEQLRAR